MRRSRRSGYSVLADPILNKGTAFSEEERDEFDLHGLLPPHVSSLEGQVARRLASIRTLSSDLEKYIFLRDLQDTNETLFFAVLTQNIEELLPIVYTPTVGLGCQRFSNIYRKPRGLFLGPQHRHRLDAIFANQRFDNIDVIVVTDGERILGLGDQGAGGMGIPIGKLALYTACGGIDPSRTLPIMLDMGTNNQDLHHDPAYIGWRHERLRGEPYDHFVEEFVEAVMRRWPNVLLQWEDFAGGNASLLLERYRNRLCTFNDDIQGTAAIVVGAVLSALFASGQSLTDQRIVVAGAGAAGCGISELLVTSMVNRGLPEAEARARFYLLNSRGLVTEGTSNLAPYQLPFAQKLAAIEQWGPVVQSGGPITLVDVVTHAKPTILLGVSGQAGLFNEAVVRLMAMINDHPLIFPISNPTSKAEATPADIMAWTEGRAVIGTGSPFPPLTVNGEQRRVDQVNNSYIFPGLGLGTVASGARRVTDKMFLAAAEALAEMSPARHGPGHTLLPPVTALRHVALHVGTAVARQAYLEGLTQDFRPHEAEEVVRSRMWEPVYESFARG